MRSLLIPLLLLLSTAVQAAWVAPGSKTAPADRDWPGRVPATDPRGIDVLDYDLAIDLVALPPQTPRLEGRATLRFRLLSPPPGVLRLDLVDQLAVSEMRWFNQLAPFTQEGDSLLMPLPPGSAAGDTAEVTVVYAGTPPRHGVFLAGLLLRQRDGDAGPTVGNVNQPYSSHSWFPCKDHPHDKATLSLTVTAPDTLTVAATGRLLGTENLPGGRRSWRWRTEHPVATYLVGLMASDYVTWQEDCGGIPLAYHAFAEHLPQAQVAYGPTCAMMTWLQELLGPYPFADEKYAQAEFQWFGAMENQTVTAYGQVAILAPDSTAHAVTVHELAHHWLGNSLTPRRWQDIWLNEGFARYVELLWYEHTRGAGSYRHHLHRLRPDDLFVGDGLLGDPDPVLPSALVYDKGAWVVHLLRLHLGDAVFFRFLRDYASDPGLVYGLTDRETMIAAASRAAGRDLTAFFAPWLDTEAVPELGLRWRPVGRGRTLVEVVQQQGTPFFPLTVPVRVHARGEVVDLTLRMDDLLAGTEVLTSAAVDSVILDPEDLLLKRTAATPAPRLLAAQPRPNPAVGVTRLAFWLAGADRVSAEVYDLRGRLVYRADLGAYTATGEDDPHVWTWSGEDAAGRRVAAGVYWLILQTRDDRTARKVTLLR
jgi:aminopeptidase N